MGPPTAGRWIQDELAVARHHVIDDLGVARAALDHIVGDLAQVLGQIRVGVREVLVLANQAAQLRDEFPIALFLRRTIETERLDARLRGREQLRSQDYSRRDPEPFHAFSVLSLLIRGIMVSRRSLAVTGPMCL